MNLSKFLGFFFSWKGEIGRSAYAFTGIALFLVKWNLDRLFSVLVHSEDYPTPFFYLLPETDFIELADPLRVILPVFALALPFIYVGIVLTVKRLRSLGWPIYSSILFFVPFLNLLFFFLLSILPKDSDSDRDEENEEKGPSWLDRFLPKGQVACAALVAGLSAALGTLFVFLSLLTQIGQDYGWGFFVGLPFAMGLTSAVTYGHHEKRKVWACLGVALLTLAFSFLLLLALAIEGIICLFMAAPIALPLAAVGGWVGYLIQNRTLRHNPSLGLFLATFFLMGFEKEIVPEAPLFSVRSEVIVKAPPEKVWTNVVSFSDLPPAKDWIFRLGIACPTCATIEGTGVGAIRHCNFTTGPFVEPITVWDEPNILAFDVTSQPPPMKELSPYDIHPPHLNGHLESKRGEFRLERLDGGRTRLIGTTWYKHNMWPAFYWKAWSDFLIGRIHRRVLDHVKNLSEED
ncbi:MAG TPA: hypothetical protein DCG39_10730 [Opitutae bacterium]|nr:hypothetical protein [Opitutae bacterium]